MKMLVRIILDFMTSVYTNRMMRYKNHKFILYGSQS